MKIRCRCGSVLPVSKELGGKKIRCGTCKETLLVPSVPETSSSGRPRRADPIKAIRTKVLLNKSLASLRHDSNQHISPAWRYRPANVNGLSSPTGGPKKNSDSNVRIAIGVLLGCCILVTFFIVLVAVRSLLKSDSDSTTRMQVAQVTQSPESTDGEKIVDASSEPDQSIDQLSFSSGNASLDNSSRNDDPRGVNTSENLASTERAKSNAEQPTNGGNSNSSEPVNSNKPLEFVDLIELVEPSVVRIDVESSEGSSIGSGVFVDESGLIVTNFHVVKDAMNVVVTTPDSKRTTARGFLRINPVKDLAVIAVDPTRVSVVPIRIATQLPRKGEEIAAFGSPLGFSFSATQGIVSSMRTGEEVRSVLLDLAGVDVYSQRHLSPSTNWIQMTAAISGGNSGGPLVNMRGELVGINTFTNPLGQSLNFASTYEEVESVLSRGDSELQPFYRMPRIRTNAPRASSRDRSSTDDRVADNRPSSGNRIGSPFTRRGPPGRSSSGSSSRSNSGDGNDGDSSTGDSTAEEVADSNAKIEAEHKIVPSTESQLFKADSEANVVRSFQADGAVIDLALTSDDNRLAATTSYGKVFVFDNSEDGKLLYRIDSEQQLIRRACFDNSMRLVTSRNGSGTAAVHLRDSRTGRLIRGLNGKVSGEAQALAISLDGRSIFAKRGKEAAADFFRVDPAEDIVDYVHVLPRTLGYWEKRIGTIRCAVFSKDNRTLFAGDTEGFILAYSGGGNSLSVSSHVDLSSGIVRDLAINPEGSKLVAACNDGQLRIISADPKSLRVGKLGKRISAETLSVCVSDDGQFVSTGSADGNIRVYDLKRRSLLQTIKLATLPTKITFFRGHEFLIVGAKDGKIRIVATGDLVALAESKK